MLTLGGDKLTGSIPFCNKKVWHLYRDAASKETSLLLDITSPRVTDPGNVKMKADCVQRAMKKVEGIDIAIFIYVGKGMSYRLPGESWVESEKDAQMYDALGEIESKFHGPLFAFGFAKMRRGFSNRSPKRVVTHMCVNMGVGHCVENTVQAVGRANFIGKELLHKNGHTHVTALLNQY